MSPMSAAQPQPDPQQEALRWFSLLRQPGCDAQTRQAFAVWCQDPLNAHAYAELEACWQQLQPAPPARPRPQPIKARRSRLGKCLALLFLLVLGALAYLYWPWMQRLGSELHTDVGERRSVRLSDGSTLHLDSASAVNVDLRGRTRLLHLVQGQVDLEVMLDGRAMEIEIADARIQVLGTRLTLARRADHNELTVLSGKAMVIQGGDQRMVSSGERVTFDDARINAVQKADGTVATAWRTGYLQAKDMPLAEALERLAAHRGQRLTLWNDQAAYRRVTATFNLDRSDETLAKLAAEQQLQLYSVLGQWLIVR